MKEFRLLKYRIDLISVALVLTALGIQLTAFAFSWPWYTFFLIILLVRQVNLIEHNHAHLGIFEQRSLNEILGFLCFYSNGTPYEFYKVHHVQNHHAYNQQFGEGDSDWSSMFGFKGTHFPDIPIGRFYYVVTFPILTICHSLIFVFRNPGTKILRRFVRTMILFTVASAALIYIDVWSFLFFFAIPWVVVYFGLGDNNYSHHHGCKMTNDFDSSNTFLSLPYKALGFHIGCHVAHHIRPDLHWSLLPEYQETIKDKIPQENYRPYQPGSDPIVAATPPVPGAQANVGEIPSLAGSSKRDVPSKVQ